MMSTLLAVSLLFAYHPPTDETQPKHDAVREAEAHALVELPAALEDIQIVGESESFPPLPTYRVPLVHIYGRINAATLAFAETIQAAAPPCLHRDLAIVAVGLARNAANEAVTDVMGRGRLLALARTKLQEARWLACTAIACGGAATA